MGTMKSLNRHMGIQEGVGLQSLSFEGACIRSSECRCGVKNGSNMILALLDPSVGRMVSPVGSL
jgi:hypothetical protein